jgi:hypothetical protein
MRNGHGLSWINHPRVISALALVALAGAGCATQQAASVSRPLRPAPRPTLAFENTGTDPVKLYLSGRGSEWLVGYVSPGEAALLPLPSAVTSGPATGEFRLVVVPAGSARSIRAAGVGSSVIRSEPMGSDYLTAVRWQVAGRWLIALPGRAIP